MLLRLAAVPDEGGSLSKHLIEDVIAIWATRPANMKGYYSGMRAYSPTQK